ncbi:ABC transporter permease [Paraburkholderia silvatlantica]|uniref:NitT/TauT family transport system permease protein n=1 Tax=Paraburkholderia silvatlantica TaxID=321895 RepID=A0ABR6FN36_9BURK|nr:ABC transporter permease [Paraburkholderia silvatlantica]MBB2927974.1 NitT/TauT family transport system permease protein [Paraburkholderia silvatlantica]PVY27464.1 NitT/TauT family transport system permease protein [Paraburkholderia silvatlantica]PXW34437.1 NitT/TauT family transport system permease protein [Paraburkholderia silvatlantica]
MIGTLAAWRTRLAGAGLIGPAALIALWAIAHSAHWVTPHLLPGPLETFSTLWDGVIHGAIWPDLGATVLRTGYAFAIALVAGIPAGVLLGSSPVIYRTTEFVIDFFRSTPATAMFPLFLLVFGIGEESKVAVAAFSAWLVIVFNTAYGVMNARRTRILAARVMGASNWRVLCDVMFYESLPQTFIGLRLGVSYALVVIIVAEMFIGSSDGMGRRIIDAEQVYDLAQMYATIIATGCIGYCVNLGFLLLERSFVKWAGK